MREHPLRTLILLLLLGAAGALAYRNATADAGGVYDPAEHGR